MKYQAAFVHTSKCAGTSLREFFYLNYPGVVAYVPNNRKAWWVKFFRKTRDHTYHHTSLNSFKFKFTFVRNPFDRLVSTWQYFLSPMHTHNNDGFLAHVDFKCFIENLYELDPHDFSTDASPGTKSFAFSHVRPYTHSTEVLFENGDLEKPTVDFFGKVENLKNDLLKVLDILNLDPVHVDNLNNLNTTNHDSYQSYYTPRTIDLVTEMYENDLKYFNYKFNDSTSNDKN